MLDLPEYVWEDIACELSDDDLNPKDYYSIDPVVMRARFREQISRVYDMIEMAQVRARRST